MKRRDIEKVEIDLLVSGIRQRYGYDFCNYSFSSLKRRIARRLEYSGFKTVSELLARLLRDNELFEEFLRDMSVTVTQMFRDPLFFEALRQHVVPILKKKSVAKIWHAGCATGEEVYSMAILLHEEGCLERCRIYATDYNNRSLVAAKEGIFPLAYMQRYATNYYESGGEAEFSDYFYARYDSAKMNEALKRSIVFSNHNLVNDPPLADIDVVVCRNVLIYFDQILQDRVFKLFLDSLSDDGFLCLGSTETVRYSRHVHRFSTLPENSRIFRKVENDQRNETQEVMAV